jgi:hypothetical protein
LKSVLEVVINLDQKKRHKLQKGRFFGLYTIRIVPMAKSDSFSFFRFCPDIKGFWHFSVD